MRSFSASSIPSRRAEAWRAFAAIQPAISGECKARDD
jgi:hypothetical protein